MATKIDTSAFYKTFNVNKDAKFAHYEHGYCRICGRLTTQVDACLLWDGLATYLCSDDCYDKYWGSLVNQTKED